MPRPVRNHHILLLGLLFAMLFTIVPSVYLSSEMPGLPVSFTEHMDTGWTDENGVPIEQLPCKLEASGTTLRLSHTVPNIAAEDDRFFVFQTRYESIRVWADDTLIYETAQTKKDALGSRWHFVPADSCKGASSLRIELTRFEEKDYWRISAVFFDHTDAILIQLLQDYAPAILFGLLSLLFVLVMIFICFFMAKEKIPGIPAILALTAFVFLSGQWILLDSKITTLFGGNYALSYFFSYCAFYLLMAPFLLYIQLLLDCKNRALQYLSWAFIVNTVICMGLHLAGLVDIQSTAIVVHILLFFSMLVSTWELFRSVIKRKEHKLRFTFFGVLFLYTAALVSIVLYNTGVLCPTNNASLYSWASLILIFCMAVDEAFSLRYMWKEKQYAECYQKMALQDSMTLLGNRNAYELHLQKIQLDSPHRVIFVIFDVDNLKRMNDTYGHLVGDQIIYRTAQCIHKVFEPFGSCYRIGGDEFCVILSCDEDVSSLLKNFEAQFKEKSKDTISTTISYGWKERIFDGEAVTAEDIDLLRKEADENMYRHKKENKADRRHGI